MTPTVLHLAPHPDDELIGAPATLMALGDAGWRVANLACGLGRPEQRDRRRRELAEACRIAGFELLLPDAADSVSGSVEDPATRVALAAAVRAAIEEIGPAVVVSPSPWDCHPRHVLVALVVREEIEAANRPVHWWTWALWGSLPRPTIGTKFGEERLAQVLTALAAHRGELERNDYRRLVRGRAEASACLAPELLFGFGTTAGEQRGEQRFVELLSEVVYEGGGWRLGRARWLGEEPLVPATSTDAGWLANPADADEGNPRFPAVREEEDATGK